MSEILSDGELREMESELCHYKDNEVSCSECNEAQRLISSHRALQAELDTLKAELGAAKRLIDRAQIIVGGSAPEYTIWLDDAKQFMETNQ